MGQKCVEQKNLGGKQILGQILGSKILGVSKWNGVHVGKQGPHLAYAIFLKLHTASECGASVHHTSVAFSDLIQ